MKKVVAPESYAMVSAVEDDVILEKGQTIALLFKFMTHRDTSYGNIVDSSHKLIKPRRI
jgi:Cys-tRNA synthase (O-phospho-L-seryl-tRNA:Cys-tRNA synthase)